MQALWFGAEVHFLRPDPVMTKSLVDEWLPLVSSYASTVGMANARMLRGWAIVMAADREAGLAELRDGLDRWRRTGSKLLAPFRLGRAVARRLMTIPGVGPIGATAITALVPAAGSFRAGRDFAAWRGLTPLQQSTGGKQKLGAISKRGERTIRRLLILGASAVIRQACRRAAPAGSWLAQMLLRKPKMLVTVALANKMARVVWLCWSKAAFTELRPRQRELTAVARAWSERKQSMAQQSARRCREKPVLSTVLSARFG